MADFERLIEAQLSHPAIAAPLATGIVSNHPYLAAEFAAADSLDIIIRDHGPAPLGNAIALAAQLAGAIDFAAVVHIGHGSLHPRDVLVSQDDTRVTGFGIAQALERAGVAAPLRRPYAAPERVDNPGWGREADEFSVAAICYELLMGRRIAGAGTDAAAGLTQVPGLDLALARAVFARALALEPAHRFPTALEFVDALRQSVVDEAAPATGSAKTEAREAHRPKRTIEEDLRLPLNETPPAPEPALDASLAPVVPPPKSAFTPSDLDLRTAETERYQDVESSPAVPPQGEPTRERFSEAASLAALPEIGRAADDVSPPATEPSATPFSRVEPPVETPERAPEWSVLDRSRSALWPLALALVVGVALGFAAGYGVGTRAPANQATAASSGTPGREYTESALPARSNSPPASNQASTDSASATRGTAETSVPAGSASTNAARVKPTELSPLPKTSAPAAAPPRPRAAPTPTAPPSAAENELGRLLVRSTPDGARVYIDGRDRGPTPLAVRDLAWGGHRVRLVRDGYISEERHIFLSARRPAESLQIALMRPPARETATAQAAETFIGTLTVESLPIGAKVYVDGRLVGTTPLTLSSVAAGSHAVRLEHDGYRRWSSSVRVVAGERNRVTASLEK